jgi:uncharacterized protein
MEILIISDSHGYTSMFTKVLQRHPKIEFVIHLGDDSNDTSRITQIRPNATIEAVHGNCDKQKRFPTEKLLELMDKRIFITHGHNYGVKSGLASLAIKGVKEKADIILYGHSHIAKTEMLDGIWVVNPGSISLPKASNKGTYAILELSKEAINARILEI